MSTSLLYHALGIRDYGRTDHFASNGRGLAASTARGSVARVRIWPWFTPFGHAAIVAWAARRGFTGRTPCSQPPSPKRWDERDRSRAEIGAARYGNRTRLLATLTDVAESHHTVEERNP
jgi:hypothetical protein